MSTSWAGKIAWLTVQSHGFSAEANAAHAYLVDLFSALSPDHRARLEATRTILDIIPPEVKLTSLRGYRRAKSQKLSDGRAVSELRALSALGDHPNDPTRLAVGAETLHQGGNVGQLPHEAGHVIYHSALVNEERALIHRLYDKRLATAEPWVSDYASGDAMEYFAESVRAMLGFGIGPLVGPHDKASWLRRHDPEMYRLLREVLPGIRVSDRQKPWAALGA